MTTKATGWIFSQVPIWLICSEEVSKSAVVVMAYLRYRQGTDAACWPSIETISSDVGLHESTVRSKIRELEKAGYIIRHKREGRTNLYEIVADPPAEVSTWEAKKEARQQAKKGAQTPAGNIPPSKSPSPPPRDLPSPPPSKTLGHDDSQGQESRTTLAPSARETPAQTSGSDDDSGDDSGFGVFERKYPQAEDDSTGKESTRAARKFAERAASEPWRTWGNGNVHRIGDVAADDIRRVCHIVEDVTGLRPNGSITGWLVGAAGVYRAGRGEWSTIERGIREAWDREVQYRPGTLSASQKSVDRNGFVKAVAKEATARVQVDKPTNHLTFEEAMA
jgi:DNA-binding transcriptional ArsR family regulator